MCVYVCYKSHTVQQPILFKEWNMACKYCTTHTHNTHTGKKTCRIDTLEGSETGEKADQEEASLKCIFKLYLLAFIQCVFQ